MSRASRAQNIGWSRPAEQGDAPPRPENGAILLVLTPWRVNGREGQDIATYKAAAWGRIGEPCMLRWVHGGAMLDTLRAGARFAVIRCPVMS